MYMVLKRLGVKSFLRLCFAVSIMSQGKESTLGATMYSDLSPQSQVDHEVRDSGAICAYLGRMLSSRPRSLSLRRDATI